MNSANEIVEERPIPWLPSHQQLRELPYIIWRRKALVILITCAVLAVGVLALFFIEPRYTASAVIQFDFASRRDYSRIIDLGDRDATIAAPAIAIDASREVETFARLIGTDAIARRVVKKLNLDRAFGRKSFLTSLMDSRLSIVPSATDRAIAELLRGLNVSSDLRSYLLTVTYTAPNPVQAKELANAFLSEAIRMQSLTRLSNQLAAAQRATKDLTITFGGDHPLMRNAQSNLAEARKRLESEQQKIEAETDEELSSIGNVVPAEVNTMPTFPKPTIVMTLSAVLGLFAGILAALWREWRHTQKTQARAATGARSSRVTALKNPAESDVEVADKVTLKVM